MSLSESVMMEFTNYDEYVTVVMYVTWGLLGHSLA